MTTGWEFDGRSQVSHGVGWSHVWLSQYADVDDVLVALAEVGLTPDHLGSPRPGVPNHCLIYHRTLTDRELELVRRAATLGRMRPTQRTGTT